VFHAFEHSESRIGALCRTEIMTVSKESVRILIVDDEEAIRDSCRQVLSKDGYVVVSAADGSTGLKLLEVFRPHVVLVDLKMPGISGLEMLTRIGRLDRSIVSIAISGYATVGNMKKALELGAMEFLPKPFAPSELRDVVHRALSRGNPDSGTPPNDSPADRRQA